MVTLLNENSDIDVMFLSIGDIGMLRQYMAIDIVLICFQAASAFEV